MAIRLYKAYTPGTRNRTVSIFHEITKKSPEKKLTKTVKRNQGRNNRGIITSRHKGGGHKQKYRIIDFKRNKANICLLYTSPSPRDQRGSRMPSSA